jgi:hypothetical protein
MPHWLTEQGSEINKVNKIGLVNGLENQLQTNNI